MHRPHRPRARLLRAALVALVAWLATACAEDDADRIDAFVAAVTGEVTEARVDHVFATYVDLEVEPLSVRVLGEGKLYRPEHREELVGAVRIRLKRLEGTKLTILRRRVQLDGTHARVELQLLGADMAGHVDYRLEKHGERWLLEQAYIGR